jgi:apolipoprotein N-acyltransferase
MAWVGLVPLFVIVVRSKHSPLRAFFIGWFAGTVFFYGTCYWLTYAMIRYGHIPAPLAYLLLLPATIVIGLFPAFFCLALARLAARWNAAAVFAAPFLWVAIEWARLGISGQLWNAIGYSQAYVPSLIQLASWGGVYAVGFAIVAVNAAIAFVLLRRSRSAFLIAGIVLLCVASMMAWRSSATSVRSAPDQAEATVVAIQPNVPMEQIASLAESEALVARHVAMSETALSEIKNSSAPRVIIWPESPMNFSYARDSQFRELLGEFTARNRASVIFNALEPAPLDGFYNSAVMVNEEGRLIAQYDKIRLLPFGEYVPLPRWLPGANLIPVMVGDFTPGTQYPLLPLGNARAGIFICFESAFPSAARRFAADGADVLINISNDGYLGPTPVMKQHLANAVFRAVENQRPLLRVTNTGITGYVTERGEVLDATDGFQPATRIWNISRASNGTSFYTRHGDVFAFIATAISLLLIIVSLKSKVQGPTSVGPGN